MLTFVALACLVPMAQQPEKLSDVAREELKRFQGSWSIEGHDEEGAKLTKDELKGRTISFGTNVFLMRQKTAMVQIGKIKLDPAKKTINANIEKGNREGDILPGIYELDGDSLKISFGTGDDRPKDFKPGADRIVYECKRVRMKDGESDLSGRYKSTSIDIAGRRLQYDAAIERVGDAYVVLYTVQGKLVYFGTGVRKGNVFALGWASQGRPGITLYHIEAGNRLVGEFADVGGPGFLGTETLTPIPKE
jgi:uncharacterized protein (TIGR03067 family)